jgi:glutathione S-transferase
LLGSHGFSAADVMVGVSMMFAEAMDFLTVESQELPLCWAYWERLKARPAWKTASAPPLAKL